MSACYATQESDQESGVFQPAEIAELEDLRKRSVHPIDLARSAQLIEESGKHRKRQALAEAASTENKADRVLIERQCFSASR